MPDTRDELFSIVVFPYLKTSGPVRFGPYLFRSTDDLEGLSKAQVTAVTEVTAMLYTQNNARVRSASYAVLPQIHLSGVFQIPEALKRVHSLVAYMYGTPNDPFGDPFLGYECATLLVFTPSQVSRLLIESEHHTILDEPIPIAWDNDFAPGYDGILNFMEHFWVVKGSRVYPPVPHITLNISQDLAADCGEFLQGGTGYELARLLTDDVRDIGERLFTSLRWYNATNRVEVSEGEALVNLAIAFESLLNLPTGEKTDRFVDSVSLLLGRVPRLTDWVRQFYDARSRVAHEGKLSQARFMIPRPGKKSEHLVYHPLLVFGREILRLCVAAITHGAYLAESRDIAAKLQTNSERFEELCRLLDEGPMSDAKRAIEIRRLVSEINRYRFVGESGLSVAVIVGAVQRAVKGLMNLQIPLTRLEQTELSKFALVNTKNELAALEALSELHTRPPSQQTTQIVEPELTVWQLVDIAWMYTFQNYFRLKKIEDDRTRKKEAAEAEEQATAAGGKEANAP
jgi:hypothetical protein